MLMLHESGATFASIMDGWFKRRWETEKPRTGTSRFFAGFHVQRRPTLGPSWCHFHEIPGGDPARSQVPLLNAGIVGVRRKTSYSKTKDDLSVISCEIEKIQCEVLKGCMREPKMLHYTLCTGWQTLPGKPNKSVGDFTSNWVKWPRLVLSQHHWVDVRNLWSNFLFMCTT